jgi:hypothetical protein
MRGKIKKFFLSFKRLNKPAVLAASPLAKRSLWFGAVFFLIFLGLALPYQFVEAQLGLVIGTAIAVTIVNIVLQLILVVSNLILSLAGAILSWVLSPYFLSLPYTYGGIVDIGWPIVRDLVNMLFIIALVIIGLATALRIKEYQAQKALPILIAIAILINFTPIICGLIVDASNIVMNFFLEELTGFKLLGNLFSAQGTMLLGALQHFYNPLESFALMGKTLIMIIFDWVATFIFFMFSLLFIMRYVMIWALVIISPIAFFSRIFPDSQRFLFKSILGWNEWWKQFIEWSIMGVIAGFFIYLAEQLMVMAPGWIPGIPPGGVWGFITTPIVDFINQLLPWMVMLMFLIIGFFIATSTSAMGAGAITSFFREKGVSIATRAGRGMIVRPITEGLFPRAEKALRLKEAAGWAAGKLRAVPIARHLGPVSALEKYGEWRDDINKAKAAASPYSSYTLGERIRSRAVIGKRAVGELLEIVTRGDSEDYFKAMGRKYRIEEEYGEEMREKGLTVDDLLLAGEKEESKGFLKETKDFLKIAYRGGLGNDFVRRDPRLAAAIAGTGKEEGAIGFDYSEKDETIKKWLDKGLDIKAAAIAKATEEMRPRHLSDAEREVFENEQVVDISARTKGTDFYRTAIREVKMFVPTFMNSFDKVFKDFVEKAGETLETVTETTVKEFKKEYENYFEAIKNNYLRAAGLTAPWRFPSKYLDLESGQAPRVPPGVTPGVPPGLGVVPPEFEEKGPKPPRGRPGVRRGAPPRGRKGPRGRSGVGKAKIPTTITRKMEEDLRKRGYTEEEIRKMKPEEAARILGLI